MVGKLIYDMQSMISGGNTRNFAVHIPPTYDEAVPSAILVYFHGWSQTAAVAASLDYLWNSTSDAENFIVVAPEGLPCPELSSGTPLLCFQQNRDGAFVTDFMNHLGELYNIDPKRVYLNGFSGGAFFVQGHGLRNNEVYAAVAGFSGGCIASSDNYGNSCSVYEQQSESAVRKIPYFVAHHTTDGVVPVRYSTDLIQVLASRGHETKTIYEYQEPANSGHGVDPQIIPDVWAWMATHSLP